MGSVDPRCVVNPGILCTALTIVDTATVFEVILLGFVVYKSVGALSMRAHLKVRASLNEVLLGDNILYFFG